MTQRSNRAGLRALVGMLALVAGTVAVEDARAAVPQTIVVDGVNDFDPSNLIENDTGDTEIKDWCSGDGGAFEGPMDLGQVYVTNDNNYIYVGYVYDKDCFASPQVNLGMAIDVNGAFGGTTDPFGRKIGWTNVAQKPDLVVYDVVDAFNFEALYQWQGSSWANIGSTINPGYGGGSNGLGIVDNTGFVEFRLPLSVLGSPAPGTNIRLEWWMTQDGVTKGPLDAVFSDGVQMSRATTTTFDTTDVVEMLGYKTYAIQNAVDSSPPTLASATATGFALLANRQFALTTNKIDVQFSEPVDATTSQSASNYALTNAGGVTVTGAVRDPSVTSLVHLTLSGTIAAQANPILVTATGVKDLSNNTIVANGTTNVRGFHLQNVTFRANTEVGFCKGIFTASDSFWVEGNVLPLTFAAADNARMIDPDADRVYTVTVPFSIPRDPVAPASTLAIQWKLFRSNAPAAEFEARGNRETTLSSADGAARTLDGFWNDDDPANFTTSPMDVVFRVNASAKSPGPGDVITLLGSESPLSFTQPGLVMTAAGGGIYTRTVRFPKCTRKDVRWKVDYNGVFECVGQGDRSFTLNQAVSDTTGGTLGPLVLPARGIEFCTTADKAVAVVFSVDMYVFNPNLGASDTVRVNTFSQPDTAVRMQDDGVAPDGAVDQIFTRTVVFPQGSDLNVTYKFSEDGVFECFGANDRSFVLDDVNHSVGNPQVRPQAQWDWCADNLVAVPRLPGAPGAGVSLAQNVPNPAPRGATAIAFELPRAGAVTLAIYDVAGRRIARLVDGELPAGPHQATWDGRDEGGRSVPAGVYFYDLVQGGSRTAKRMVVLAR
jgi:hypothetical protein